MMVDKIYIYIYLSVNPHPIKNFELEKKNMNKKAHTPEQETILKLK